MKQYKFEEQKINRELHLISALILCASSANTPTEYGTGHASLIQISQNNIQM